MKNHRAKQPQTEKHAKPHFGSAYAKIEKAARELIEQGKASSLAAGVDLVIQEQPQLFIEFLKERSD